MVIPHSRLLGYSWFRISGPVEIIDKDLQIMGHDYIYLNLLYQLVSQMQMSEPSVLSSTLSQASGFFKPFLGGFPISW